MLSLPKCYFDVAVSCLGQEGKLEAEWERIIPICRDPIISFTKK